MNIAFIPVRGGSKSIPGKNIKSFCGKPLVYWSLNALNNSTNIDKIFVATDCSKTKKIVQELKFKKISIFNRTKLNASDTSSTESVLMEFLNKGSFSGNDLIFLVQATSPFTQTSDIDKAYKQLKSTKSDSLLSCVRFKRFLWNEVGYPINYDLEKRPRRQEMKGELLENGAIYISSVSKILKSRNRISGKISIYEMDPSTSVEIDEEDDWLIGENLMRKNLKSKICQSNIKLFLTDVDGTLTDAGMYYAEDGNELKKFNTRDGHGFKLLQEAGIKSGIITSENTNIVRNRAKKLKVDYLFQGKSGRHKLDVVKKLCDSEHIHLKNVAFIGDDINDFEVLSEVGYPACPSNADEKILEIPDILTIDKKGGDGCVRRFIDKILGNKFC